MFRPAACRHSSDIRYHTAFCFFNKAGNEFMKPLTNLFNKTQIVEKILHEWELANVKANFKKGFRSQGSHSIMCKLIETIIKDEIFKYLKKKNILKDSQHSFRNERS